ncbi:MAG: hypothetical protein ACYCZF_05685 [Anaerolineae bacterium]
MRRVSAIGIIVLVFLCCSAQEVAAAGPGANTTFGQRLSQDARPNTNPQISVLPDGHIWLAWIVDNRIIVFSPDTPSLTEILPRYADHPDVLKLTPSQGRYIAWSEAVSDTNYVLWQPFDIRQPAESHSLAFPLPPTFGIDRFGRIHAAWALSDTLHYVTGSPAITRTLSLSGSISDLSLSMDESGTAYLCWVQSSSVSTSTGIYFLRLEPVETPLRIAALGIRPQVQIGSDDRIHLAYILSDTLVYANSDNWQMVTSVATDLTTTVPFALAIGTDDQAHLVWARNDVLEYANSVDWSYSLRSFTLGSSVNSIAMALDNTDGAHIVYARANESDRQDIYYLKLTTALFQLAIATPLEGDLISQPLEVEAISNLPPSSILRVSFYLELNEPESAGVRTLIPLGSDSDGSDGWSTHIRPIDTRIHQYRLCAFGTTTDGRQTETCSKSFTILPGDWPDIWLTAPISNMTANPIIYALVNPDNHNAQLDLWAQHIACAEDTSDCLVAGRIHYLGRTRLVNTSLINPTRQRLAFETSGLPDGVYLYSAAPVQEAGVFSNTLQIPLRKSHTLPPRVWVLPTVTTLMVSDTLEVAARVEAKQSSVTHVDFYLVRAQPLLTSSIANSVVLSSQRELWLGSSTSIDNWRVRVPLGNSWLGEGWRIKAIAYDQNGMHSSAYATTTLSIIDFNSPYLSFIHPGQDEIVQGSVMIQVLLQPAITTPVNMRLYLQNNYGDLSFLGDLENANEMWSFRWDTSALQNSRYTLIAIADFAGGRQAKAVCAGITIANTPSGYRFASPPSGSEIGGTVGFIITPTEITSETLAIRFTIQASDKRVWDLGPAIFANGAYGLTWNSLSALDGPYTLTALILDPSGQLVYLEELVSVNNATPKIAFQGTSFSHIWKRTEGICWQASDQHNPLSVRIESSPDDGIHWVEIARNLDANACFSWDTRSAPDATANRLRLTATNGRYQTRLVSASFIIDNVAEQPALTLLAPLAGSTLARQTRIAWESWNPDAGDLLVEIAFRLENRAWITLASGLPALGEYFWDTAALKAQTCDLRLAARTPMGRLELVTVSNLVIKPEISPIVRLFSPKGGETLASDGLILWNVPEMMGNEVRIDLYYSDNAGQTWLPLAENLENTGYYQWQVSFLPAGNQYRVRIVAHNKEQTASAESPNTFSIGTGGLQQTSLLQPMPGADLIGQQLVSWYVADNTSARMASLYIRPLGKTVWQSIARYIRDNGFYIWDTTLWADGLYELRLAIHDGQITTTTQLNGIINLSNHSNHAPQVQLLEPQAGESLDGLVPVHWQVSDRDGDSLTGTLSFSHVGSDIWHTITHLDAYDGYYLWDTRVITLSGDYHLRLDVTDGQSRTFSELSAPVMLLNQLNEPGYLTLTVVSTTIVETGQIAWLAQDALGNALGVNLALSDDGGNSWRSLADSLVATGSFYLDLQKLEPGINYAIRLGTSAVGIREELPTIVFFKPLLPFQKPKLEIQAPGSGVTWTGTQEVLWLTDDPLGRTLKISLDLSADGGINWESLALDAEATGTFLWDTTQSANGAYLLRITADNNRVQLKRTTEPFRLVNSGRDRPVISLLYPMAGEVWSGTRLIKWQTRDPDKELAQISLAFSTDNGSSWQPIAIAIPDTGSYVLDTNILPNCTRVWLRATVSDGFLINQDLADGPIAIFNPRNPVIKLLTPTGGQISPIVQPISWLATNTSERHIDVELTYSINNGVTWLPIAKHLPANGSYFWNTAAVPPGSSLLIQAVALDGQGSAVDTLTSPLFVREAPASPLPFFKP